MSERETIAQAAIQFVQDGVVTLPRPARYAEIIARQTQRGRSTRGALYGFTTNTGRFVDKYGAMRIAVAAGQVPAGQVDGAALLTEDLW